MNVYLRPLVDSLNDLYHEGKYIVHNAQLALKSDFLLSVRIFKTSKLNCSYVADNLIALIGFEISTESGPRKIKAAMVAMSCDLPARALVLNMKQFNGEYGCHLCEDPGESSSMLRWWPYKSTVVSRTKESLLKNSLEVANTQEVVSYPPLYLWGHACAS
jgi:hypothetical protein